MENISTSASAKQGLVITLLAVWAVIQLLILFIFSEAYLLPGTLVFLAILFFSMKGITGNVKMNQAGILLNAFSKKSRAVFEGFYWKLPWEQVQYKIDLEATIDSDVKEDFPTTDGSLMVNASIMSKPDSGKIGDDEICRSKRMVTYVRFTKEAQKGMQESRAKQVMREVFQGINSEDGKKLTSEQILKKEDFGGTGGLEEILSIKVIKCIVKDIDYNEEVQRVQNAISKAEGLAKMVEKLKLAGYTDPEAKAIAPLLDKDISLKKQINDVNFNGLSISPALLKTIESIISKLGGK